MYIAKERWGIECSNQGTCTWHFNNRLKMTSTSCSNMINSLEITSQPNSQSTDKLANPQRLVVIWPAGMISPRIKRNSMLSLWQLSDFFGFHWVFTHNHGTHRAPGSRERAFQCVCVTVLVHSVCVCVSLGLREDQSVFNLYSGLVLGPIFNSDTTISLKGHFVIFPSL